MKSNTGMFVSIAAAALAMKVVHVGSGREFVCENTADGAAFDLPADFKADANADVFRIAGRQY